MSQFYDFETPKEAKNLIASVLRQHPNLYTMGLCTSFSPIIERERERLLLPHFVIAFWATIAGLEQYAMRGGKAWRDIPSSAIQNLLAFTVTDGVICAAAFHCGIEVRQRKAKVQLFISDFEHQPTNFYNVEDSKDDWPPFAFPARRALALLLSEGYGVDASWDDFERALILVED